ncbi:hypothetical protein B0H19DRAFT_1077770 [Mycena capillaripes]|nr:hypothetical protein B0H19DRAFT_1077770 [Mycena capillaripes]
MIFSTISSAFSEVSLPTVPVLFIPQELYTIFHAFPHLRTLVFQAVHKDNLALWRYFNHVDTLAGLRICHQDEKFLTLATRFPALRVLSIATPFKIEFEHVAMLMPVLSCSLVWPCIRRLAAFIHLSELVLFHVEDDSQFLSLEALVSGGRDVLRASQSRGTKVLRVWANDPFEVAGRLVHVE